MTAGSIVLIVSRDRNQVAGTVLKNESSVVRAHIALLVAMVIWGSSFIALKFAVSELAPMIVVFSRFLVGATAFLVVWLWIRPQFDYKKGDWKYLLGMTLFEPCLYFVFEARALQYTSAGQAGMVTAMLPLMVALSAYLFLRETSTREQWFGFLIAVLGVVTMTVTGEDDEQAPNPVLGNFLEFLAMCSAVGYTLMVKYLVQRYSAFLLTALQSFVGVIFFFPFALGADWPGSISTDLIATLVYLGLVVTLGAYGLFNYGLTHLSATTSASYTNLLPVITLVFSMWLLGEQIALLQWGAIALVILGVVLSQPRPSRLSGKVPPAVTG
ncbi:MAG: EamA family transporter [Proteobacteria bacterium]|nr:MAG: EamA family transporter [Pseudomonadota bacterium]PIE40159.1 MAG: EamA family transporter [Gammaproteobacteria bacterium]